MPFFRGKTGISTTNKERKAKKKANARNTKRK